MDPRERFDDPEDAQRTAIAGALAGVWTALVAVVTKVDLDAVTVEVQPVIKAFVDQPDGSTVAVSLPLLVDVPIVYPRGGGATLTFPITPGDECLVVFSARSIDTWWQSGGVQIPNEARRHDLSDGLAIFGPFSQATKISGISPNTVQLRSNDGAVFYELNPATGAATITAPGGLTINANITHSGNQTTSGDVTASGISLVNHTHLVQGVGIPTDPPA
jgi:hypothetical protein